MHGYFINPSLLNEYINFLEKSCFNLQANQTAIEKSFRKLGTTWNDAVYNIAGDRLADVSASLKKVYNGMCVSIQSATEYYNNFLIIQKMPKYCRGKSNIPEFHSTLKKGEYNMDTFVKSNNYNVDDMSDFIKELYQYIFNTVNSLTEIQKKHQIVGETKTWVAPQYNQFGEILQDIQRRINVQLENLNESRNDLIKSYNDLIAFNDSKIKGDK